LENKEILILGAGGFSLSAENPNNNHFTYVDIDPDLEAIVKQHFLKTIPGKVIVQDARVFLNTTPLRFDVIVSDAYSHARSIPAQLLTQEYFAAVNQTLKDSGMGIFNIVANPSLQDPYSKRVDNTIRSVFTQCMVIPVHFTDKTTNIIYVCQKNKGLKPSRIYTDDLNSATLDYFKLMR
jgi:spermidine synthase